MKIPQLFMPEKDLDDKVKQLKNCKKGYPTAPKYVDVTEFLKNDMGLLYGGHKKRNSKGINSLKNTVHKIVQDTFSGSIEWRPNHKKDERDLDSYTADAIVTDAEGKEMIIPVLFYTENFATSFNIKKFGYLHLGDKRGPCINTVDQEVKRLARAYFKIYDIGED